MSNPPVWFRRRAVLSALFALGAAPLAYRTVNSPVAAAMPHLTEDDATAKALKYHHDAKAAPRTDKPGTPAKDQFCHNCNFIQAKAGDWRPCQLFPGKSVNANGWCASWIKMQK